MAKNETKWTVTRVYKCSSCEGVIAVDQEASEEFIRDCPFCKKEELLIESGHMNISVFVDLNKPKTIGALAEKNSRYAINEGLYYKKTKKKYNYDILKNPNKYVAEGAV